MIHQFVRFLNYHGPLLPRIPPLVFPTVSLAFVVAAFGIGCGGFVFSLFSRAATNHNCKSLTTGNSCPCTSTSNQPRRLRPRGSYLHVPPLDVLILHQNKPAPCKSSAAPWVSPDLHFKNAHRLRAQPTGIRRQNDRVWGNTTTGSDCFASCLP